MSEHNCVQRGWSLRLSPFRYWQKEVVMQGQVTSIDGILHLIPPRLLAAPSYQLPFSCDLHIVATEHIAFPEAHATRSHRHRTCPAARVAPGIFDQTGSQQPPSPLLVPVAVQSAYVSRNPPMTGIPALAFG